MVDTPPAGTPAPGETATPAAPSNEPSTAPAPVVDNSSNADVEAAKKEAEQARLRANQLQNELDKERQKAADAEKAKLAENEEWKTLAEKSAAELKEFRDTQDAESRRTSLKTATDVILQDFPENVKKVAETAGLSLTDDSEASKATLKEKLEAIKAEVGSGSGAGPNNPPPKTAEQTNREDLTKPGETGFSPMAVAGAKGDRSVINKYIGEHPAIQEMKKMAGLTPPSE